MAASRLQDKQCKACPEKPRPLDSAEITSLLEKLGTGWKLNKRGHLSRIYKHKDFLSAMAQANRITAIAEEQNHHPDLTIRWGACAVEIYTYRINALSENDFILAAKIENDAQNHG